MAVGITSLLDCPIHVIIGVGAGEMADYLIGVHVGGSAAAGLEDVYRELVVVPAFHDLFCRGLDRFRQSCRQVTLRPFIFAAALLTIPSARINDRGKRLPLIGKFWTARAVCGP
jgi:hypothetical protein